MKRTKLPKCKCGCNQSVSKIGNKFIAGHNFKIKWDSEIEQKRRKKISKTMIQFLTDPVEREKRKLIWKGRSHTKESKLKMSIKGIKREKLKKENGYIISEETRRKISIANKGRICSELTRRKISEKLKGKIIPEIQKIQISKTLKNYFLENENPFKGKHHTKESLEKMSKALYGKYRGEKASNWQGGIDSLPYAIEWTIWFIKKIKKRDNYTCQNSNCINPHPVLDVHHIDYNKQNNNPNNLITLCKKCHGKTQKNREYWTNYYQQIIKNRIVRTKFRVIN